MSDELPHGWATVEVGVVLNLINGFAFKPSHWGKIGLPIIRIQNLNNPNAPFNYCDRDFPEKVRVRKNDLLFAWSGTPGTSFGAHVWNGGDALLNQHIFRVEFEPRLFDKAFLKHAINQNLDRYIAQAHGGAGLAHITKGMFEASSLRVAPFPEQQRIVAKLEALLCKVDASQQRLAKVPVLLKRFRQSVLAAACSGRLTADWREENPKSREWKPVRLAALAERIQIGPFGTQLHKADYISNGVPLINPTHIQSSKIIHDPEFSVSKTKLRELGNYVLQANDIIMGRRGEMARCALVSPNESGWLCGTGSLFVRPKSSVCPAFLFLVLRSPATKAFLESESKGTTMSNLNLEILKNVPVSISSLLEQREIVRRAEGLFALADQLELRLAKARGQVDKLTPSLLARAFAGKLIPQDPNDEPASSLLERIRQQKNGTLKHSYAKEKTNRTSPPRNRKSKRR